MEVPMPYTQNSRKVPEIELQTAESSGKCILVRKEGSSPKRAWARKSETLSRKSQSFVDETNAVTVVHFWAKNFSHWVFVGKIKCAALSILVECVSCQELSN